MNDLSFFAQFNIYNHIFWNCLGEDAHVHRIFVGFFGRDSSQWARASLFTTFLDHTQRRTTVGRTPLDDWSARRRDLYLTTHKTGNKVHVSLGIRTHNHSRRAAADLLLRPRGHWDRPTAFLMLRNLCCRCISFDKLRVNLGSTIEESCQFP